MNAPLSPLWKELGDDGHRDHDDDPLPVYIPLHLTVTLTVQAEVTVEESDAAEASATAILLKELQESIPADGDGFRVYNVTATVQPSGGLKG